MSDTKIPYCEILQGKRGFSDKPMIPPPSEKGSNVIQFELTQGCSHNRCTFCNMYTDSVYSVKSLEAFKKHVDSVLDFLPRRPNVSRIFVGSGDALSVDTEKLVQATQYSLHALYKKIGMTPNRLAVYGNTMDILKHGMSGMSEIRCGGTCRGKCSQDFFGTRIGVDVVYWGLESGNSEVLKIAGKGYNMSQALDAGEILNYSKTKISVMVMPGLGGKLYFDKHVKDTVAVLNNCEPEWITFMTLKAHPDTPYSMWMNQQEKNKQNRPLTPSETIEQMAQIIERLDLRTRIGIHGDDVHQKFCINPVTIGSKQVYDRSDCRQIAKYIRRFKTKK